LCTADYLKHLPAESEDRENMESNIAFIYVIIIYQLNLLINAEYIHYPIICTVNYYITEPISGLWLARMGSVHSRLDVIRGEQT